MSENENTVDPNKEVTDHIEAIIKMIVANKVSLMIEPSHATDLEVFSAAESKGYEKEVIRAALNRLYKEKRIIVGPTVNNRYISLHQFNQTKHK